MLVARLRTLLFCLLALITIRPASAQGVAWDTTGNGLLNGLYNFRQVFLLTGDSRGDILRGLTMYGTIRFDGAGKYNITAQIYDSNVGVARPTSFAGTYAINGAGYGFMDSPVLNGGIVYGTVSHGVFIGSSPEDSVTDGPINDLMVAAVAASSTTASFNGAYSAAEFSVFDGDVRTNRSAQFQLVPNGAGGLASTPISGYIGGSSTETTGTITSSTYSFSGGVGTLRYGGTVTASSLLFGNRTFYLSPDNNFVFGGSPTGFDFFAGARSVQGTAAPDLVSGLYYNAGLGVDGSALASSGFAETRSYYGAVSYARGVTPDDANAVIPIVHQRRLFAFAGRSEDLTFSDRYTPAANGTFEYLSIRRTPSADGNFIIGSGRGPVLGLEIGVRAPALQGNGVYLNPQGIVNAASSAPFTAGVSPGEFVTLYGTNLSADIAVGSEFPLELAGVQVTVNGQQAPVYYVSPTQVSFIVPYAASGNAVVIQVINKGVGSNTATLFLSPNSPGVFTKPYPGFGPAASLHSDNSEVTQSKPARPGEVITVFVTGLGQVVPPIVAGEVGGENRTENAFIAFVDGLPSSVIYAGLAPGTRGLYQLKIEIPAGASNGAVYLDVSGFRSYNSQAQLWVSNGSANLTSLQAAPRIRRDRTDPVSRRVGRAQTGGARDRPGSSGEKLQTR